MSKEFIYTKVAKEGVDAAWVHAMPWIQKAMEGINDWHQEMYHVQAQLREGYSTLWCIQDPQQRNVPVCFVITFIIEAGGFRTLVIRWMAGVGMDQWLKDIDLIEGWAQAQGCHKIEVWGRPGWVRVLRPFGYSPEYVVVSKVLPRGVH